MTKSDSFGKVAGLLNKFQARLDSVKQTAETALFGLERLTNGVHGRIDQLNLRVLSIENQSKGFEKADAARLAIAQSTLVDWQKRLLVLEERAATIAPAAPLAKDITESLYALRDSTAKAFDAVKQDMEHVKRTLQSYNARLSELESKNRANPGVMESIDQLRKFETYTNDRLAAMQATINATVFPKILGYDSKGAFEYIHPLDMGDLISGKNVKAVDYVIAADGMIELNGVRYKQNPTIPRRGVQNLR